MTVVDAHGHAWPHMADERFGSRELRMGNLQRIFLWHYQPVRRKEDDAIIPGDPLHLYDGAFSGISHLKDVNMRVGKFGRIEWTHDGVDYYRQWQPPNLQEITAPPEYTLAQMDYVGVDKSVLSRGRAYGLINDWLADVCRTHPERFAASAQINEWEAFKDEQLEELRRCVEELDCRALYFEDNEFFRIDYAYDYDDPRFDPFWDEIARLGVPVQWELRIRRDFGPAEWDVQWKKLLAHVRNRPDITHVITHGFDMRLFEYGELSDVIMELASQPSVYIELLFHLINMEWEYPYPEAQRHIRRLYDAVGPDRLMWGGDLPAGERACTYRQSLDYIRVHLAKHLPAEDIAKILGGNAVRLFELDRPVMRP